MNFSQLATKGRQLIAIARENAPSLLAGLSGFSTVTAVIFAAGGAPKALRLIEAAQRKKDEELTTAEKIKAGWRPMLPAAIATGVSLASLAASLAVSNRRTAAVASLYSASELALEEYRNKTREAIGEKEEAKINNQAQKAIAEKVSDDDIPPIPTGKGEDLFVDAYTGTKFKSSVTAIDDAVNVICHRICTGEMFASLNELRYEMNIGYCQVGDEVGFNPDHMPSYRYIYPDNGETYITIEFGPCSRPIAEYRRLY